MAALPKTTSTTSAYSGIDFPPRRAASSGFFAMATDEDLIKASIYTILNTKKGAMPMVPDFGSSAQDLLFEPINDATQGLIADAIQSDIEQWEPRVSVNSITAATVEDMRVFQLTLQIKATGQILTQTIPFVS